MDKKNLRRINCTITAQTLYNLEKIAKEKGYKNIGMVIDQMMIDKMREGNKNNKTNY